MHLKEVEDVVRYSRREKQVSRGWNFEKFAAIGVIDVDLR